MVGETLEGYQTHASNLCILTDELILVLSIYKFFVLSQMVALMNFIVVVLKLYLGDWDFMNSVPV